MYGSIEWKMGGLYAVAYLGYHFGGGGEVQNFSGKVGVFA